MANSISSAKRVRQNARNRTRNRQRKSAIKAQTRKFGESLHQGDLVGAEKSLAAVQKKLDQVAAKGTLHRNTAARRKSRLARQLNAARSASKTG